MENARNIRQFVFKMQQAREACEEAWGLLEDDAELRYVANSLFYVYYYSVLALLHAVGADPAMQSVSIALFEKLFAGRGIIDDRFFPLIRKAFALKPKCTESSPMLLDRAAVVALLKEAHAFSLAVEAAAERDVLAAIRG